MFRVCLCTDLTEFPNVWGEYPVDVVHKLIQCTLVRWRMDRTWVRSSWASTCCVWPLTALPLCIKVYGCANAMWRKWLWPICHFIFYLENTSCVTRKRWEATFCTVLNKNRYQCVFNQNKGFDPTAHPRCSVRKTLHPPNHHYPSNHRLWNHHTSDHPFKICWTGRSQNIGRVWQGGVWNPTTGKCHRCLSWNIESINNF